MDALYKPPQAWQTRARTLAAELRSSSDADVRDLAAILDAHLLLLQDRFDEAADAFEEAIRRDGGTGRLKRPSTWWATATCSRADRSRPFRRTRAASPTRATRPRAVNMGFQGEGIVAALVDLGRHEEALETLGACDTLTGDNVLPREHHAFWGGVMAGRIASARTALGSPDSRLSVCTRPRARRRGGRGTAVVVRRPGQRSVLSVKHACPDDRIRGPGSSQRTIPSATTR